VSAATPAPGWTRLLAAAVAHDINNLAHGLLVAPVAEACLEQMRKLGARLRALAAAADTEASARLDDACADALAEVDPIRDQVLRAMPIPADLRVRAPAAALRTAIACLLEHAAAASPSASAIGLAVRQAQVPSPEVVVEISSREASGLGELHMERLDVLLGTTLRDLRGDLSLVLAGAIADALGGAVHVASSAKDGLLLALRLVAAPAAIRPV